MTKALRQWQTSPQPSGQALTDIGTPLRSIAKSPGYPTGPLPGSNKLPVLRKTAAEPIHPASGTAGVLDGLWFTPQSVLDVLEGTEPRAVASILGNPPPGGRVVRVTRGPCYTHDARVQCAPGERPFGAGFAAAGPGVDITTGRAWE